MTEQDAMLGESQSTTQRDTLRQQAEKDRTDRDTTRSHMKSLTAKEKSDIAKQSAKVKGAMAQQKVRATLNPV